MRLPLLLAGGLVITALAAAPVATAAPPPASGAAFYAPSPPDGMHVGFDFHAQVRVRNKLRALRQEAVALQRADGGELTEAHRAELAEKLALLQEEACQARMGGC